MTDKPEKHLSPKEWAGRVVHHLFAFLLLISILFWPGILSYEKHQNWYVPIAQPDGIVDGGQILCVMTQTLVVLTIALLEVYITRTTMLSPFSVRQNS
jgi:hypothetical protein